MKITLSCEPWRIYEERTLLKLRFEYSGEIFSYDKVIENDFFQDDSIFKRIVLGMAEDIQQKCKELDKKLA